jgi:hypothetical protein
MLISVSLSLPDIYNRVTIVRASKRDYARRNKTDLGLWGQAESSIKIEDLRSNKTTGNPS